jgi:hypothetical protein
MSGFFSKWVESYFQGKRIFDVSLFRMTPEERIAKYGIDKVEELRSLSPNKRIDIYGSDFSEYFNTSVMNPPTKSF